MKLLGEKYLKARLDLNLRKKQGNFYYLAEKAFNDGPRDPGMLPRGSKTFTIALETPDGKLPPVAITVPTFP